MYYFFLSSLLAFSFKLAILLIYRSLFDFLGMDVPQIKMPKSGKCCRESSDSEL
jgi:hypothetical protein